MITNVWVGDLALIDLLGGSTDAPRGIIATLETRGYVSVSGGKVSLTAEGRTRANKLKQLESTLRARYATPVTGQNRPAICAVPGPSRIRG